MDILVRLAAAGLMAVATWFGVTAYQRLSQAHQVIERLAHLDEHPHTPVSEGKTFWLVRLARLATGVVAGLPDSPLNWWSRTAEARALARQVEVAHLDGEMDSVSLFGVKALLAMSFALVGLVATRGPTVAIWVPVMAVAGYLLPNWAITRLAEERQAEIRRLLPDALDILVIGLEAGLAFDRVVRFYVERFEGALSDELGGLLGKIEVGQPRRQALVEMAARSAVEDLILVVSAVAQAERLGTPLAEILAGQAEMIRRRHRQWVEEQSAKAPVKMLFPLAGLVLPALFLVLLGPVVARLVNGG